FVFNIRFLGGKMVPEKLGSFLHHCAKTKSFRLGISLHAAAIKTGTLAEVFTGNHVLNFYAKCGCIDAARHLFDEMPHRNLVTWSAMISGYGQSKRPRLGLQLFSRMQTYFKPNEHVFASVLSSCSEITDLYLGRQIHAQALKLRHACVIFVLNSLILMYMKCGMCTDALSMFTDSKSDSLTLVSYNIAITGLVENKRQEKGIELFRSMSRLGLVPDRFTFAGLLGPGQPIYDLSVVMQLHGQMLKLGLDYIAFSGNILIALYSSYNLIDEPEKVFRSIEKKDAISWNTAIAAFCHCEDNSKALDIFREMVNDHNVGPDDFTYASVLSAAARTGSMRNGKEIHARLIRTRRDYDVGVGNSLVNMYAKNGSITSSYAIFQQMEIRNIFSWNSIIAAFANHGLAEKAIALFEEMTKTGLQPDSVTFLELLTACNHSGLLDAGRALFNSMSENYGITPAANHLCCLVDLLGRAGRLTEANEYASKYSVINDAVVLGSLLSSCRLHGGFLAGEEIAKKLLELGHVTKCSPYVLLSNLYAMNRKWDCVDRTRNLIRVGGLEKEPACSLIEVNRSIKKF
ncbi:hypothetical protein MIMGU_mgv1a024222mg, partial [Erythranthe guttata]